MVNRDANLVSMGLLMVPGVMCTTGWVRYPVPGPVNMCRTAGWASGGDQVLATAKLSATSCAADAAKWGAGRRGGWMK